MVTVGGLTNSQARLSTHSDDERDFRLRSVLAGHSTIDKGDTGPAVRFVQQLLGRFGSSIEADGVFGPLTENAVERFQRSHGLRGDGVVGDATLKKLLAKNPAHKPKEPLRLGQGGAKVEKMESQLARLGYLDRAEVGGKYDAETAKAVRQFRRDQPELRDDVTGNMVGSPMQRSLAAEVKALQHAPEHGRIKRTEGRVEQDQRTGVAVKTAPIGRGDDRRGAVANVQRHLKAAGYDPQNTDGNFDERTEAALKTFQRRSGLPATGAVDAATWKELKGSIILAKDGTSPPQERGERSAAVKRSEKLLKKAGYNPGAVDGKFDNDTLRALHRFQKDHPRAGHTDQIGDRQIALIEKAAKNRGLVKPLDAKLTSISEFGVSDPEGAPANNGNRYHAGKDWFAPAGTKVKSPIDGKIVEVRPSTGNSGQVFGGTVKVQGKDGKVWVFRHVNPADVHVGQQVQAGKTIARVTDWTGGPDHTHVELWKTLSGGYDFENMIDPMKYLKRFL